MSHSVVTVTELPPAPARLPDSHKGIFGRALLIGGSRGMSGAVVLAGAAALRGGAGLVAVAVPAGVVGAVAAVEPSYLTVPLPEATDGCIRLDARELLTAECARSTAVGVGPGLGLSSDVRALVRWLYLTCGRPLVLDADALNALASMPDVWDARPRAGESGSGESDADCSSTQDAQSCTLGATGGRAPRILTPHPGEFSRLTGRSTKDVQSNREELAVEFAQRTGVVLVLKGHRTVITDGRRLAINETGNGGMATGGTGDVLTGLITSLAAQGMPAFDAARLGAHLHGLAGDLAAAELSQPGLIASDLLRFLGPAWKAFEGRTSLAQ